MSVNKMARIPTEQLVAAGYKVSSPEEESGADNDNPKASGSYQRTTGNTPESRPGSYNRQTGTAGNSYQRRPAPQSTPSSAASAIQKKSLPDDFVDEAERVMKNPQLGKVDRFDPEKRIFDITTSKIRDFLSLVSDIYNTENTRTDKRLDEKSMKKIQMMRIRVLYDAGREESVMKFIKVSNILSYIQDIGDSRQKFIDFAHYVEALVAYHRFLGGKEN
jgi:CRISPR-associated protein Csm2